MPGHPTARQSVPSGWTTLFLATFLAAYLYAFMEWLFILTKPSFMDALSLGVCVQILIFTGALLAGLGLLFLLLLYLAGLTPPGRTHQPTLLWAGALLPAGLLSILGLLLLDNFTYSLFGYGIVSTRGMVRGGYGAGFAVLACLVYRWLARAMPRCSQWIDRLRFRRWLVPGCLGLLAVGLVVPWARAESGLDLAIRAQDQARVRRPNILLLTSDGVDADHLSLYGYERDTSPNLRALAGSSLVAENAYTNASTTAGSIVAMLTGKSPVKTRLVYPPNILNGKDRYQHLPGILHALGYYTVQISTPYYVDAYEFRLLNGFDIANGRALSGGSLAALLGRYLPSDAAYFLQELATRAGDRLQHIFYIKKMSNVYRLVTEPAGQYSDRQRADELLQRLNQAAAAGRPLFAQVHFMGTHGPRFAPQQQVFSAGKDPAAQTRWEADFYDDSLREFDQVLGYIVAGLQANGLYDQTILVVGTDHGQGWVSTRRLPLLVHFPQDAYAGRIMPSVQYLDIAPTLLDYLGVAKPGWMAGRTLLKGKLPERPIFATYFENSGDTDLGEGSDAAAKKPKAPLFQFVTLVYCNRWYRLDLAAGSIEQGAVDHATAPCEKAALSQPEALDLFTKHFKENNFEPAAP